MPDQEGLPVSFTLLLNLAAVCHAEDPQIVWAYVSDYIGDISPQTHRESPMIGYAVNYYQDMVRPHKTYRLADETEAINLEILKTAIAGLPMIVRQLFNRLFMRLARRQL